MNRRTEPIPAEISTPSHESGWRDTAGRVALGLGLASSAVVGASLALRGEIDVEQNYAISTDEARPSNDLSDLFNLVVDGGAVIGGAAVAARGVRQIRMGLSPQYRALQEIAAARPRTGSRLQRYTAMGALSLGTATMTGSFIDIAEGVSDSQPHVASAATRIMDGVGGEGETFLVTNSPHPELSTNGTVPQERAKAIVEQASVTSIPAIPMRWEWHTGQPSDEPTEAKRTLIAVSLPEELTELPPASESCDDISVTAAKQLGVEVGDNISMDGLTLKVHSVLTDEAGVNMLPVIFNNKDFAQCVSKNPDQPFSAVMTKGEQQEIEKLLEDAGISTDNLSEKLFVVPETAFTANTKQTGENSVNGLVLQAMATGLILGGVALGNKSKAELQASRQANTMLRANGMSNREIRSINTSRAATEAFRSSVGALPAVVLVDTLSSTGLPGSEFGLDIKNALCVIGLTTAATVGSALRANRTERNNLELGGREL